MTKETTNPILKGRSLSEQIILWSAFGFGTGFIRPAPGTWGTLPGVFIAYFVMPFPSIHAALIIALSLLGIYLCKRASDILGVHDHGGIVIDEIVGVLITLFFFDPTWVTLLLGFFWFRVFDIIKPWPIKWIDQHVHGGLGIMLDDILAGVFAWVLLFASLMFIN
ncbi:MAG: phosphatidylglycerophosphatase A [Gammaproteobacteria bacterium]|nr:phosphatidylglycerophosphatase A [Gammaproteobacteria bacterium]